MVIGTTLFIVAVLIIAVWIVIEIKRFRHKIFALFLIGLILFMYFSFTFATDGKNIDFKTVPGLIKAAKLYFSWLGYTFENLKTITVNVIGMDWKANETIGR